LGKIIFPITLITTILGYTPVIGWLSNQLSPFMAYIGLPGEAAIPLLLGNVMHLYAAIGAILSLDMTVKEVFIIAIMLSLSHNMFVECAVTKKMGAKMWVTIVIRVGSALLIAMLINLLWQGGEQKALFGFLPDSEPTAAAEHWGAILWIALSKSAMGIVQLAIIVFPVMLFIQVLKDLRWLDRFASALHPVTRLIGLEKKSSVTIASGFLFGLAYGAGVMIQAVKEDDVRKKDIYLVVVFLSACHAVVEDTLIFVPLGIPVWPLLLIRFIIAFVLTFVVARAWNYMEKRRSAPEASLNG
jgi:hypothetical protein